MLIIVFLFRSCSCNAKATELSFGSRMTDRFVQFTLQFFLCLSAICFVSLVLLKKSIVFSLSGVFIHPKSVNFQVNNFHSPWLVYHEKVKTCKVRYSSCWRTKTHMQQLMSAFESRNSPSASCKKNCTV